MFRKKVTEIGTSEPKKEKVKKTKEQKGIAFKRAFLIFVSAGIVLMSSWFIYSVWTFFLRSRNFDYNCYDYDDTSMVM